MKKHRVAKAFLDMLDASDELDTVIEVARAMRTADRIGLLMTLIGDCWDQFPKIFTDNSQPEDVKSFSDDLLLYLTAEERHETK